MPQLPCYQVCKKQPAPGSGRRFSITLIRLPTQPHMQISDKSSDKVSHTQLCYASTSVEVKIETGHMFHC